jgi:chaperonin GroES
MKLKPLADRVVVVSIENEEVVKGGIVLPTAAKEKPQMAEIVKVIYSKYAGTEVKLDDKEYLIVRQSDVLAIVE